jgi:hypothetical protein
VQLARRGEEQCGAAVHCAGRENEGVWLRVRASIIRLLKPAELKHVGKNCDVAE